jgi:hypothetical protein
MPPEQLHNLPLTKASDIYGLGVTLICSIAAIESTEVGSLIDFSTNRLNFEHLMPDLSIDFLSWLRKTIEPDAKNRFPNAKAALVSLQSISISRSPEIKFSSSTLEFKDIRCGAKQTQILTIYNSVPETILAGSLQIEPHRKDPPHTPDNHAWIEIYPRKFKSNKIQCKVRIDTSKLKPSEYYIRWLLVDSNGNQNHEKYSRIKLEILTAPKLNISSLPYGLLSIDIIFFCGIVWLFFPVFTNLFTAFTKIAFPDEIIFVLYLLMLLFICIFVIFLALIILFLILFVIIVLLINTINIVMKADINTISEADIKIFNSIAKSCYARKKNTISRWSVMILSRLTPAFGICLGIGLHIGLSNPWVITALTATALPVVTVIAQQDLKLIKKWQRIDRETDDYLIDP